MLKLILKTVAAAVSSVVLLANAGCNANAKGACVSSSTKKLCRTNCGTPCGTPCKTKTVRGECDAPQGELTALPPNAKPGECYAKVYIPPTFKTVTERVLVKEATEQLEIIPAKYEWVEERVCVKDASTRLIEEPAQYESREITVQVEPGHTDWKVTNDALCKPTDKQRASEVFCLVNHPPVKETISRQCQVKGPSVREEHIPAQYETVRREKLVSAATTRKICIPAEYETVEKTVKVCDGRMAWQRVICERPDAEKVTVHTNGAAKMQLANR